MKFANLSQVVEETVERLVSIGVSREVVERELKGLEWACIQDLTQAARDDQLLLRLTYGTASCVEVYGVSERTLREWKKDALNRKAARRPASA